MAKADTPEPTPFQKFEDAARRTFQVPKMVEKAELRRKKEREPERLTSGSD